MLVTLLLARMKNILSGGRVTPLRATTRSNCATSAGSCCCNGSNLLKSGSTMIGERKTPNKTATMVGIQNQNHQRFGDHRITQNNTITSSPATIHSSRKLLPKSANQLPQRWTDNPYASAMWCPNRRNGAFRSAVTRRKRKTKMKHWPQRLFV